MRPSIIVGDSRSGWTSAFNVLYWPLRAFARGLFEAVPAVASAPVDVVPVDYVADGIYEIVEHSGGIGETYHLTAGAQASTIAEISQLASSYFSRPAPRVLTPDEFEAQAGDSTNGTTIEGGRAYFPYFSITTEFDDAADARPPGAGRDQGVAAGRLHGAPAGLRHAQPVGQAADRRVEAFAA